MANDLKIFKYLKHIFYSLLPERANHISILGWNILELSVLTLFSNVEFIQKMLEILAYEIRQTKYFRLI